MFCSFSGVTMWFAEANRHGRRGFRGQTAVETSARNDGCSQPVTT